MKFHQIPIDITLYADTLVTLITRKGKPILGDFSGFPDFRLSLDQKKAVCGRATGSLLCRLDHIRIIFMKNKKIRKKLFFSYFLLEIEILKILKFPKN